MSANIRQNRRSGAPLFDSLESKLLLNGAHPASPVAEVRVDTATQKLQVTITSQIVGGTSYFNSQGQLFYPDYITGSGKIKKVGSVQVSGAFIVNATYLQSSRSDPIYAFSDGSATLTNPQGDQLELTYSGTQRDHHVSPGHNVAYFKLTGAVVGGSGIYSGASGSLSGTGTSIGRTEGVLLKLTLSLT